MHTKYLILTGALALLLAGCEGGRSDVESLKVPGGDAERGRALIAEVGCGRCHVIPGVDNADGKVGPPLTDFAQRSFIAGRVPNGTDNLIKWLMNPHAVAPGTAMPDLGLSEAQARDMAAYLYTLQ